MLHTHPPAPGQRSNASHYHFSPQDFISFLEEPSLITSIVVTPGLKLLMLKTDRTPHFTPSLGETIQFWERISRFDIGVEPARRVMRFTKEAAKRLNLALYRVKDSESPTHARQIILPP